ncbi:hypothetical protein DFH09DRAFT_1322934 [Mycena vulgaris]|nr:hypothetical protein DFH09DRAFT_1322934 [Mycena vulgaris]
MKFTTAFFALIPLTWHLTATRPRLFVCTDAGFTGSCTTLHGGGGECVDVLLTFNDNISAVGPDSGQECFFFRQVFRLISGPVISPGMDNLGGNIMNDAISSFQCFVVEGARVP